MNIVHTFRVHAMLLGGMCLSTICLAEDRHFAIPSYLVNSGAVVHVPITLDNAAGLASINLQINFDQEVLKLEAVTPGPLGQAFEFSEAEGGGFVQLIFVRADELIGGSGRLATLQFRAYPGAIVDLSSELTIADLGLSDATSVIDLRQKDNLILSNGEIKVSAHPNIDNARSGLPDWWEISHGLDPLVDNRMLDLDYDGMPNLLEYAFGGNPRVNDALARQLQTGDYQIDDEHFMKVGFYRRIGDPLLSFRLQESLDLVEWNDLNFESRIIGAPQNLGNNIQFIEVLGTLPMTGPDASPSGFMRVIVDRSGDAP
jgi:hypothetical protein